MKKLVSIILVLIMFLSIPLNSYAKVNWTYFSKMGQTLVYDTMSGSSSGEGNVCVSEMEISAGGSASNSSSGSTFIGVLKACTSAFISRCDQNSQGFVPR